MTPTIGRIVHYFHREDNALYPAMVLEVTHDADIGSDQGPPETDDSPTAVCHLQIFRPRANEWKRAVEGVIPGTWRWPEYVAGADLKDVIA